MMPELNEPIGRHRWDPLVDAELPLMIKKAAAKAAGDEGEIDQPSPASSDTSA